MPSRPARLPYPPRGAPLTTHSRANSTRAGTGKLLYDTAELIPLVRPKSAITARRNDTMGSLNISFTVAATDLAGAESRVTFTLTVVAGEAYTISTDGRTAAAILRERKEPSDDLELPEASSRKASRRKRLPPGVVALIVLLVFAGVVGGFLACVVGFRKVRERLHDRRAMKHRHLEPAGELELRRANSL